MSLHRIGQPQGLARNASEPVIDPIVAADLVSVLRGLLNSSLAHSAAQQGTVAPKRDYETAFELLDRASGTFQVLIDRCQELEAELDQVKADARAERMVADATAKHWQNLAGALQAHVDEGERQLAEMQQRIEAAEANLAAGRDLVDAAEQQATVAIDLTTLFHDKIIAAFGVGSPAHTALDMIATTNADRRPAAKSR